MQERLFNLLPAEYRIRDSTRGEALRALMAVLESEYNRLEQDIDGLYDDWFIETCAEYIVPYIGDLLGVRNLYSVESAGILSQRAYVANTLRYRRRKGTAPVLEQLARDVTGWPARAVEFFERLITTQHMNHVRSHSMATLDLRDANQLELLGGPFENATHTVEVRRITSGRGRYNVPNIGLFLWRLQSYFIPCSTPRLVGDPDSGRYTFSPLGNNTALFNRPQTESEITHLAQEINVPDRLRRRALYDELEALRQAIAETGARPECVYFGINPVLQVLFRANEEWEAIPPEEMLICDLSGLPADGGWRRPSSEKTYTYLDTDVDPPVTAQKGLSIKVAVDPVLGRLALPENAEPVSIAVNYAYGFSSDIGGGPYRRCQTQLIASSQEPWTATVGQHDAEHASLDDALTAWKGSIDTKDAIITITDNGIYEETISTPISLADGQTLTIQAADEKRPTLRLSDGSGDLADLVIIGGAGAGASLTLNGLWFEGGIRIDAQSLGMLQLDHCTLVPGRGLDIEGRPRWLDRPSIVAELPNADLRVTIRHSVLGPLRLPDEITDLTVQDSIIHSPLRDSAARRCSALISGNLNPFPLLSSESPAVDVQIGDEGPPHMASLGAKPGNLGDARKWLEEAIWAAHSSPAFAAARVIQAAGRLIVLSGSPAAVKITPVKGDLTSEELKLTDGNKRLVQALVSPPLSPFPTLSSSAPALNVTMGDEGPHTVVIDPAPGSVAQARDRLHTALRAAHTADAFTKAIVGSADDQLVVLPGTEKTTLLFGSTDNDRTTFMELGLYEARPAVSGGDVGQQPGPKTSIERATIFGTTYVRELTLSSEVIFTDKVIAQRRQAGCTRFSFIPQGSQVPRRYRCQPDLALSARAREVGKPSADKLTPEQREAVLARMTPIFTSERYGDAAYAQLSIICAQEICTGAEDGSEMGVFSHLKQPQRETNLRATLEEYLRFGLEAGIFYVT